MDQCTMQRLNRILDLNSKLEINSPPKTFALSIHRVASLLLTGMDSNTEFCEKQRKYQNVCLNFANRYSSMYLSAGSCPMLCMLQTLIFQPQYSKINSLHWSLLQFVGKNVRKYSNTASFLMKFLLLLMEWSFTAVILMVTKVSVSQLLVNLSCYIFLLIFMGIFSYCETLSKCP